MGVLHDVFWVFVLCLVFNQSWCDKGEGFREKPVSFSDSVTALDKIKEAFELLKIKETEI
jgi:hypothetical protein